jgi:hypothetical protein
LFIFLRWIPGERQWWCTCWWGFDVQWRTARNYSIKQKFVAKFMLPMRSISTIISLRGT